MKKNRTFLVFIVIAAVIFTALSFWARERSSCAPGIDTNRSKEELIYSKAEEFLDLGENDKATSALFMVINNFPESEYAEKSLRKIISFYSNRNDRNKVRYYYKRLLKDFPNIKDAEKIRSSMENINMKMMSSPAITEDSVEYEVQPGDSLFAISKRFNTTIGLIRKVNGIEGDLIRPGQKLKIIISKFSIFVDKHKNILTLKKDGEVFKTYKISTGKDNCTPVGTFTIEEKLVKPVWYKVGAVVAPDSEEYALGARWMGISAVGYGIHGTSDEKTIGGQVTQGCVRMYNDDVVELFDIVPSGTEVEIVDGE